MIYSTWWEGGLDIDGALLLRLADLPHVEAVKWSAPTADRFTEGLAAIADRLVVIDNQGLARLGPHPRRQRVRHPHQQLLARVPAVAVARPGGPRLRGGAGHPRAVQMGLEPAGPVEVARTSGGEGPYIKAAMDLAGLRGGTAPAAGRPADACPDGRAGARCSSGPSCRASVLRPPRPPRSWPDVAATQPAWALALESAPDRSVRAGSKADLAVAIGRGADLRVYTEFLFEEHIVPGGNGDPSQDGVIREVIDFRETILVGDGHVGAITTQRQPLEPPFGFNGTQPRMSFFMYTSDGDQALAGLVFGGVEGAPAPGERVVEEPPADMPKMGPQEFFDVGTSGPSRNFVYDMETYRYFIRDDWEEILAHDADGRVTAGSFDALEAAQMAGREIKVGILDLAADLATRCRARPTPSSRRSGRASSTPGRGCTPRSPTRSSGSRPRIRCATGSGDWDVAWVFLRTDGHAVVRSIEPYGRTGPTGRHALHVGGSPARFRT